MLLSLFQIVDVVVVADVVAVIQVDDDVVAILSLML